MIARKVSGSPFSRQMPNGSIVSKERIFDNNGKQSVSSIQKTNGPFKKPKSRFQIHKRNRYCGGQASSIKFQLNLHFQLSCKLICFTRNVHTHSTHSAWINCMFNIIYINMGMPRHRINELSRA